MYKEVHAGGPEKWPPLRLGGLFQLSWFKRNGTTLEKLQPTWNHLSFMYINIRLTAELGLIVAVGCEPNMYESTLVARHYST